MEQRFLPLGGYVPKSEEEIVNNLLSDEELAKWLNSPQLPEDKDVIFGLQGKDKLTQKKIILVRKWSLEFANNLKQDIAHFKSWPDLFKYLESMAEQAKATQTVYQLPLK